MNSSNEHITRWKTAVLLLLVIALVAYLNTPVTTWLFFGVVYTLALKESCTLFKIKDEGLTLFIGTMIWLATYFLSNPLIAIFVGAGITVSIVAYKQRVDIKTVLPIFYPTVGVVFFWLLYRDYGMESLLWLLVIVVLSDVGAYYVGKKVGKKQFSPTSPNKTIEGVYGGLTLATIAGSYLILNSLESLNIFITILIALIVSLSSIFGDLFESFLKREAGVKDSGDILPGHGGILDRIDGYLFGSVALYAMLNLFY
jgi:phosphatidate cytidylyltransferase